MNVQTGLAISNKLNGKMDADDNWFVRSWGGFDAIAELTGCTVIDVTVRGLLQFILYNCGELSPHWPSPSIGK